MNSRLFFIIFLFVNEVFALDGFYTHYSGPKGSIFGLVKTIIFNCTKLTTMTDAFTEPFNQTIIRTNVAIIGCQLPPTSYAQELRSLNIDVTKIEHLQLYLFPQNLSKPGNYMQDLKIRKLNLVSQKRNTKLLQDFLEPLSELTTLKLSRLQIPHLPPRANIKTLDLMDGAAVKAWGNCYSLRNLTLLRVENIPTWPANCSALRFLSLEVLPPEILQDISVNISSGVANLETFQVYSCTMYKIPYNILHGAKHLSTIDFTNNVLQDNSFLNFPEMESLTNLNLSYNKLSGFGLEGLWQRLPNLRTLNLDSNTDLYGFCDETTNNVHNYEFSGIEKSIEVLQSSSLETLSFRNTAMNLDCFSRTHFSNLQSLMLSVDNVITTLRFQWDYGPKTNASNLRVDFGNRKFLEILFNETDYDELHQANETQSTHLTFVMGPVPCDCQHGWLARALRDFPNILSIEDLRCDSEDKSAILEQPPETMECTKQEYNGCLYRTSWRDNTVVAECRPTSKELPPLLEPLHGLNVSGNGISALHCHLPQTLQWVDLRRNSISRADAETAEALFADGRRVWLGDNLLDCYCDNALLDTLLQHQDQVEDFDFLKCVGSGQALSEISMAVLCQVNLIASLATAGVLAIVVAGITALVWRRYGEPIKIFLYTRGICLWCLRQKDLDDDMPYDAFLSFAHGDEEYVREQLLPGLERAPEQYRVCVHYRDWVVGDWIPSQILRSVQNSKRTIILLSRHFVRSRWSSLEFRYAAAHSAQQGGRPRLLVLVLDDVLEEPLNAELQSYLEYNTYLRCDDSWFWDKLRYAMPHRHRNPSRQYRGRSSSQPNIQETSFGER